MLDGVVGALAGAVGVLVTGDDEVVGVCVYAGLEGLFGEKTALFPVAITSAAKLKTRLSVTKT